MTEWLWDGPLDSDEEIEELVPFKNHFEVEQNIKFSKNGFKSYIDEILKQEEPTGEKQKEWEQKLSDKSLKVMIKGTGYGSNMSKDIPIILTESKFNKMFKMNKVAKMVSLTCFQV